MKLPNRDDECTVACVATAIAQGVPFARSRADLTAFVLVTILVAMTGCASSSKAGGEQRPGYRVDPARSPARNLELFAALEEQDADLAARVVPLPPGVDPQALAPRPQSDQAAHVAFDEVLNAFAAPIPAPSQPQADEREIDPVAATAAQRHYIRGREAALAGRHYQAITEFHRAIDLDADAVPIMRELARSHQAIGNAGKAIELYSRIAQIDPAHDEATFALAVFAANHRDWEMVIELVARRYSHGGRPFDHDPAAEGLAQFTLAAALRSLGYDRAYLEAARKAAAAIASTHHDSMYHAHIISAQRQQSELWRGIGDAYCRLGEFANALEAYDVASVLPAPDPTALHPRVIYTNLRLGRTYTAQYEMLAVLQEGGESISDRDVRLCAYLADHVDDVALLREEMLARYRAAPDASSLARAAAALVDPGEASALLREFIARRPRDVHVASQLLAWLGERDLSASVALAAQLIESHPDLAGEYVTHLVFSTPRPSQIIEHTRALPNAASAANIESRVLVALGALGEAWSVAGEAMQRRPNDRALLWLRIELAALLEEPELLRETLAQAEGDLDPVTWLFRARAQRTLGQVGEAVESADRAVSFAMESSTSQALAITTRILLERALSLHAAATAATESEEQRRLAQQAADQAEQILEREPQREAAYDLLVALYRPGGLLGDADRFRSIAEQLLESNPDSRLYARLSAGELLSHGRYDQAIERLVNLYDSDRSDTRALGMAVEAWTRNDQLDAARVWLSAKLIERPGDPALLEQWVTVMLRQDRFDDVLSALSEAVEREPRNYAAIRLLESTYRAAGQVDRAFRFGEQRLLAQPAGIRRDIELAALYGGAGMSRRALELLDAISSDLDDATYQHLLTAIAILNRLEIDEAERDRLMLAYAAHAIERFPQAPLQVYGLAMRILAKFGGEVGRIDELAQRAAEQSSINPGTQVVAQWRDLAQALIGAGEPVTAARALRPIIFNEHAHQQPASDILAIVAFVADAASGEDADRAHHTISLIEDLAAINRLPRMPGMEQNEPATISGLLYHVSQIYSLLGNEVGAETLLVRAVQRSPDDAMILNNLGFMRIERGEHDEQSVEWIERAHELAPRTSHILDTIGWLRYLQGRLDDVPVEDELEDDGQPLPEDGRSPAGGDGGLRLGAISLIRAAIDASEEPIAEVHDHLGDACWRLGRRDEAVASWETAVQLLEDPDHRAQAVQNFQILQTHGWGVLVADPRVLYDRLYAEPLERIRAKLEAAGQGKEPQLAPTFAELNADGVKPQAAAKD